MTLYFLRHGVADWPNWQGADDDRPLTESGRTEMHRFADFLCALGVKPDAILSSPLPRAWETAEIAARALERDVIEERTLADDDFDEEKLRAIVKKHPLDALMLVGHQPTLGQVVRKLTGANLKLAKGGLARVDTSGSESTLVWLLTPKFALSR